MRRRRRKEEDEKGKTPSVVAVEEKKTRRGSSLGSRRRKGEDEKGKEQLISKRRKKKMRAHLLCPLSLPLPSRAVSLLLSCGGCVLSLSSVTSDKGWGGSYPPCLLPVASAWKEKRKSGRTLVPALGPVVPHACRVVVVVSGMVAVVEGVAAG